jgi:uncharacterized protein (TIRG00374 family)
MHRLQYSAGPCASAGRDVRTLGRALLVVAGLAFIGYLVAVTGLDVLLGPIQTLSWRIAVIIVVPQAVVAWLHTLAWRFVLPGAPVSLARLFGVRLAGEALNEVAVSVGGEPVKAYLLRPSVPLVEGSASVVVDKTAITASQVLFLAVGLALALGLFTLPADLRAAMVGLLALQVLAVGILVLVQWGGALGWTLRLLERFGRAGGGRLAGLLRLDRALAASYRERPGRIAACVLVHLLGWVVGSLEVYLALRWLQVEASLTAALVIDALATGVKFMAFAVPGALGVLEGGFMLAFGALGLGGGLGLSFGLIRRLRVIVWSALGLVALVALRTRDG